MWTNVIDAASGSFCRGLNGVVGHFPSPCLTNAGRPALVLAAAACVVLVAVAVVGWRWVRR